MDYKIRKTKMEEMKAVEDAHRRSIKKICSKDYSPEQIEKFAAVKYTEDRWEHSINNDYHIVVEKDGVVEGMCHAKVHENGEGEIVGLYFTDKVIGRGIGRKVMEFAFEYMKEHKAKKFFLNGTITAKPFYEKMGFQVVEKKKASIRGTEIDCFLMERSTDWG